MLYFLLFSLLYMIEIYYLYRKQEKDFYTFGTADMLYVFFWHCLFTGVCVHYLKNHAAHPIGNSIALMAITFVLIVCGFQDHKSKGRFGIQPLFICFMIEVGLLLTHSVFLPSERMTRIEILVALALAVLFGAGSAFVYSKGDFILMLTVELCFAYLMPQNLPGALVYMFLAGGVFFLIANLVHVRRILEGKNARMPFTSSLAAGVLYSMVLYLW